MTTWPNYFPKQCPPADARKDNVLVFRLVDNMPPSANDFLPTILEQPHRAFDPEELCAACSVSVFRNYQDILKKHRRYRALRGKKIVQVNITENDGLVLETFAPSHMTWWLQIAAPHAKLINRTYAGRLQLGPKPRFSALL
jgi:hypothetical protein